MMIWWYDMICYYMIRVERDENYMIRVERDEKEIEQKEEERREKKYDWSQVCIICLII